MTVLAPVAALAGRELVRFWRQKSRVVGGVAQPLLIWGFLGAGFSASFRPEGHAGGYAAYVFPGILMLMLLFSSVFSAITLIEDRDRGFLQGVLAAPLPRFAIVLGKVGGGTVLAVLQTALILAVAPLVGAPFAPRGLLLALPVLALASLGFAATGFAVAWSMRSTAGFHAIMMVVLMPAWMLSGALFPAEGVPTWLAWTMAVNPLTHADALLRAALTQSALPPLWQSAIFLGWVGLALAAALARVARTERGARN
ncbi:conserved membrane hypothetical protein [uncultured Alphaproteobacteria bacterium]|uniref:Transport permease protein n=1 Tax=uncultured Alphaproteobacteria bacterium TaxID=91750 RepID=A0A212KMB7_9PROT|nr:conserved membrane hypothetical protein [uncultured Alphaproteobacteria bacterium]